MFNKVINISKRHTERVSHETKNEQENSTDHRGSIRNRQGNRQNSDWGRLARPMIFVALGGICSQSGTGSGSAKNARPFLRQG